MKDKNQSKNMMMGITFGIIFGTSIGVNKGNLPLWLGVFLAIGIGLGCTLDFYENKKQLCDCSLNIQTIFLSFFSYFLPITY